MTDVTVTAASDIEVDHEALDASIGEFTEKNGGYYSAAFQKIHESTGWMPSTFNPAAALLGPIWAAFRGVWGFFWTFLILEMIAWVQIGRGAWGNLGAKFSDRAESSMARVQDFLAQAEQARTAGEDPARFERLAANLTKSVEANQKAAVDANAEAFAILLFGLALFVAVKVFQGFYANIAYEKQYSRWRITPDTVESGIRQQNLALGLVLVLAIAPLTIYKFTVESPLEVLNDFPEKQFSSVFIEAPNETIFTRSATGIKKNIDAAADKGRGVFDGITAGVRSVLNVLTVALIETPWPVVMLVICVVAWRSAGPRVALFTAFSLGYLAIFGYWQVSMETVALVGAAVLICVAFGIPLGIWFGKSKRAYNFAEPVLDLMQTLPAFVYLIPIIAFFGTGNPPGILATIIFGMPPVIRLTALGMRGVPESIKEAATAFGASRWQTLKDVEVPLALPSIMAGVNQTILMCLSMVVIISLIGGGGLGKEILEALQYVATGQGLLGGFAILFCAMVMDRIVQGAFRTADQK